MGFETRTHAKPYMPQEGDTLERIAERETANGNPITEEDLALFNFGTDDPDTIDECLRDELGCRKRDADNRFVIADDDTGRGELKIPLPFSREGLALDREHTLRTRRLISVPQFLGCATIPGITFEFDTSFVRPSVVNAIKKVEEALAAHPAAKVMVFGHTDKVGSDLYNKALSERRARSMYAFITDDVAEWERLYSEEGWGIKVVQLILKDLGGAFDPGVIDGVNGPQTQQAVKNYQGARGLSVDGVAGPQTRKKLFADYMTGKHDVTLTPDQFMDPKHMGCGEFNPVRPTEDPCEANRRVTFLLFDPRRLPHLPCQIGGIGPCQKQMTQRSPRFKESFGCSFYDSLARRCAQEVPVPTKYTLTLEWGRVTDLFRESSATPLGRQERMMAAGLFYGVLDGVFGPVTRHCWEHTRRELARAAGKPTLSDRETEAALDEWLQTIIQKADGTRAAEDDPAQPARAVFPGTFCFNQDVQLGNPLSAHRYAAEQSAWNANVGLGRLPLIARVVDRQTDAPVSGVRVCFEFVSTESDGDVPHFVTALSATSEATSNPKAFVTGKLDNSDPGPFGHNCTTAAGGRKPADVFGSLIAKGQVHGFPYEASTDARPHAFSATAVTGSDGRTGVVLRPSRVAGDTYRLKVSVQTGTGAPDAHEQAQTGVLTVWRQLRVSRILLKPPAAAPFTGTPPVAAVLTGALGTITTATLSSEYAKSFHDLVLDKDGQTPHTLTATEYTNAVSAARGAVSNPRNYDLSALVQTGYNSPYLIWLTDDATYNAARAPGTRRLDLTTAAAWTDMANIIGGMVNGFMEHFTENATPGVTIVRSEIGDSYSYWAHPNKPANWTVTTSGVATPVRGCFLWYPNTVYTTGMPYSLTVNTMHEVGHVLFLRHHYTQGTPAAPSSGFSNNHDANDMCLMGYVPLTTNDHCGVCVLKLRGWDESKI